jgi:hypothetical protein
MFEEALASIKRTEDESELEARSRAAKEGNTDDAQALRAFAEARVQRQGFLPPAARRRGSPGT